MQDIRRIVRNDTRVINKLHRRVFLDKISTEDAKIYLSFYLEAANRDAFMAIKQDLLVSFVDCVERHGAKLATPRTVVGNVIESWGYDRILYPWGGAAMISRGCLLHSAAPCIAAWAVRCRIKLLLGSSALPPTQHAVG